jgi:hypothetical protein
MKKLLLLPFFNLIALFSFSQEKENYIKDNYFYTNIKSGIEENIPVKFKLGLDFQNKILENTIYKLWENETFSNPNNAGYIEKWKNQTHLETYLMGIADMAAFYAKLELKNGGSFTPLKDAEGFIYSNDEGSINLTFPFKAQNGYGNMIFSKGYYIESLKDGKKETKHLIGTN